MYLSVTIPRADFAYPTQLGFVFDGKTFLGKIAISRPAGSEMNLQFEYYPRNWLVPVNVFVIVNERRYNMVSFIPNFTQLRDTAYDPKELAQDLQASGYTSDLYPEIAEHLDYHEKDELELLLERNRANKVDDSQPGSASNAGTYVSPGVYPNLTPFISVEKSIAKGEITLMIAKDRCGKWTSRT